MPDTNPQTDPATKAAPETATSPVPAADPPQTRIRKSRIKGPNRSRTGTVARLPQELRDRINQLLDDGSTYAGVLSALGGQAAGLKLDHLRRWKTGGYQDHLRDRRLIEQCRSRTDRTLDLLRQAGHVHGFQAAQQLATAQICEALVEAGASLLRDALAASPLNYFRMLNTFARLTNGGLKCERLLDEQAARVAHPQLQDQPTAKKGLSPQAVKEMNDHLHLL